MSTAQSCAESLATLCCGLFAGAAAYVSFVEHPARMQCGAEIALAEFRPSYKRASLMQTALAVLGFVFSLFAWLKGASVWWLIGGIVLASVVPFTLIAILPTNKQLLNPSLDKASDRANGLFRRWAKLHAVRTLLSVVAFLTLLYLLTAV